MYDNTKSLLRARTQRIANELNSRMISGFQDDKDLKGGQYSTVEDARNGEHIKLDQPHSTGALSERFEWAA